jgi:hypothetical protein
VDKKPENRKSLIDQVLEEKRKEQEELEQEQREQALSLQKKRAELRSYINKITTKLDQNKPFFTPRGRYIGDAKWSVSSHSTGFEAVAKEKITFKLLIFSAQYVEYLDLPKLNTLLSETVQMMDSSLFNLSVFTCFVVNDFDDEKVKSTVSSFDHYGFFPLLYSLSEKTIVYNPSKELIDYFVSWFDPKKNPDQIKDILCSLVDEHDLFTRKIVQDRFIIDKQEAEKMLESLEEKGIIYHLKGTEFGVDDCH